MQVNCVQLTGPATIIYARRALYIIGIAIAREREEGVWACSHVPCVWRARHEWKRG